jgi:hypothetical protein
MGRVFALWRPFSFYTDDCLIRMIAFMRMIADGRIEGGLLTRPLRVPLELQLCGSEREPRRDKPLHQHRSRKHGAVDLKTDTGHSRITRGVTPPRLRAELSDAHGRNGVRRTRAARSLNGCGRCLRSAATSQPQQRLELDAIECAERSPALHPKSTDSAISRI